MQFGDNVIRSGENDSVRLWDSDTVCGTVIFCLGDSDTVWGSDAVWGE